MRTAVLLAFMLAQLGAPFVDAVVTGERVGSELRVDIEVEIEALNVGTVLAHVLDPGGEQFTTPLNERAPGNYGAVLTLPPADLVVVFEALAAGDSVLSQPMTLTDLGLDPTLLEGERAFARVEAEPEPDDGFTTSTRRWGWAALAAIATSLAMIALWAAGPRRAQPAGVSGPDVVSDGNVPVLPEPGTTGSDDASGALSERSSSDDD